MPDAVPTIAAIHAQLTAPGQPFEMEHHVIRGVPTRTWKNAAPSLATLLDRSKAHGEAEFIVYQDERWTFDRHFRTAAHLANILRDRFGVETGDRVAIAMRNLPEWSISFWGAAAAGAVVVPLNAWWTASELAYGITDSGSTVLICDRERYERIREDLPGLSGLRVIVVGLDPADAAAGVEVFAEVLGEVPAEVSIPDIDVQPEDNATIFYTSGTTGFPKGVLGTHRNICGNVISMGFIAVRGILRSGPRPTPPPGSTTKYLLSVPLFHATGCHAILATNLVSGNTLIFMYKWDPSLALDLIERERVTAMGGVPSMVWQLIEHPDFPNRDVSSLRNIGYGGAAAAPELGRKVEQLFPGRSASNGYGLTETSSATSINAGLDYVERPASVGVPIPVCDVKVVDVDGHTLAVGEVGEVLIAGPNVVAGYWGKPAETAETFVDGWLHTGDLGRFDADGFLYLVDRAKDLVIRGGENISSAEVEAALFEHPAVTDAAVIGIPHHVLGEEVGAVVHLAPGAMASAEELRAFVGERLAAFKVPVQIWFDDEPLPRNPAGKILKKDLKMRLFPTTD
jgi:long-chain acyl-CoA synthetase